MALKVLPAWDPRHERRHPGRLPVAMGNEPARDTDRMIAFYRRMVEVADTVLLELRNSPAEQRRKVDWEMRQLKRQLAYWTGVRDQATRMLAVASDSAVENA